MKLTHEPSHSPLRQTTDSDTRFRRLIRWGLDLLYPPKCILCQCVLEEPEETTLLCPHCAAHLPLTGEAAIQKGENFRCCYSPLYYTPQFRDSFRRYKFFYCWHYSGYYSRWIWEGLSRQDLSRFDCITWSPISRLRRYSRGFDQSQLLAEGLSQLSGLPLLSTLVKHKHIRPLSRSTSPEQRRASVKGAYRLAPRVDIVGKHLLLLDDILTTGSTLEEASRVLMEGGAAEVCCVTLARSKNDIHN